MTGSDEAGTMGALVVAIRSGDVEQLRAILAAKPALASARLATGSFGLRGPLHVVTDWPGYYPHGPEVVRRLIAAGADRMPRSAIRRRRPRCTGRRAQTTSRSPRP